jgi:ketosteroid isomerase-like protein
MIAPADAIAARRRLTNKFIAAHEAARLRPFFASDAKLIAGEGSLLAGVDEIIRAFEGQFRDPDFVTYVRSPERIEVDQQGARAAEHGRWVASWKTGQSSGPYLAVWRKVSGQWVIESETFVTVEG